jgi:hypothetical protein
VLRRYRHVEAGGWWCSGEDLVALKKHLVTQRINDRANEFIQIQHDIAQIKMEWGQFKPDHPIERDGKPIKYETPPKTETRTFAAFSKPQFWLEALSNPAVPIIITEGAKKGACLVNLGYAAIALPGVFNGYRRATKRLIEDLAVVCAKGRPIYICFDHDTKEHTRRNVNIAISRLGRLFAIQGCNVNVIELPGPEKGVDEFVVARGREAFDFEFKNASSFQQWQTRLYTRLTYEVSLDLNQDKLGPFCILGSQPKLLCLKSPKGSGKTHSLKTIVEQAKEREQRVILITHRVQLGQDICSRVGLPYITDAGVTREAAPHGYGLCIDSLHSESQAAFDAEDWEDAIVIIDEVEQVLWHLFNARTEIKQQRLPVLDSLQQLLFQTLRSENGQVIILDADLTDVSINFILKLAEAQFWITPYIVVNRYSQTSKRQCFNYNQSDPRLWLAALLQAIANGEKCFVVTQGQRVRSVWSATNFEYMIKQLMPGIKILCIDSETIADPDHPAYGVIDKLNSVLNQYDVVIATPTIETGVSIDIKDHFTSVWGCFWGVSPSNSARQALARVRADIPRHVWAVGHSLCGRIANGGTTKFALQNSQIEIADASLKRLQQWWENEEGYHTHEVALHTWAEMACRINVEMIAYRKSLFEGLTAEGYDTEEIKSISLSEEAPYLLAGWLESEQAESIDLGSEESTQSAFVQFCADLLKSIRGARYLLERQEEANEDLPSDDEGELLKLKRNKNRTERLRYRKWLRHKKYGGVEVTPELIEKDDKGWHAQLQNDYYSGKGREFVDDRDVKLLNLLSRDQRLWYPVFITSQIGLKVRLIEHLKIRELFTTDEQFTNSHELLRWIDAEARHYAQRIKEIFGINICENDSPIAIANKLLKKLGMKLINTKTKTGPRNGWEWIYRFEAPEDDREDVFDRWFERDTLSRNDSAVVSESLINNMEAA